MGLEVVIGLGLLLVGLVFWGVVHRLWRLAASSGVLLIGGMPAAFSFATRGITAAAVLLLVAALSAAVLAWFSIRPRTP
jgi:uncharacterized membrane protein